MVEIEIFEPIHEIQTRDIANYIHLEMLELGYDSPTGVEDCMMIYELVAGMGHQTPQKGVCLDLGTLYGYSALTMAMALKRSRFYEAPVYTVDAYHPQESWLEHQPCPFEYDIHDYVTKQDKSVWVRGLAYHLRLEDYLCQVICDSISFLKQFKYPVRIAFLDDSHDASTVTTEINLLWPLLEKRGWLIFHDYEEPHIPESHIQVKSVVDMFMERQRDIFKVLRYCGCMAIQKG